MFFKLEKGTVDGEKLVSLSNTCFTKVVAFNREIKSPCLPVCINNVVYECLVDTGSTRSLISSRAFSQISQSKAVRSDEKFKASMVTVDEGVMSVRKKAVIHLKIDEFTWDFEFWICKTLPFPLILQKSGMSIFPKKGLVKFSFAKHKNIPLVNIGTVNPAQGYFANVLLGEGNSEME